MSIPDEVVECHAQDEASGVAIEVSRYGHGRALTSHLDGYLLLACLFEFHVYLSFR